MAYRKGTRVYFKSSGTGNVWQKGKVIYNYKLPVHGYSEYGIRRPFERDTTFIVRAGNVKKRETKEREKSGAYREKGTMEWW